MSTCQMLLGLAKWVCKQVRAEILESIVQSILSILISTIGNTNILISIITQAQKYTWLERKPQAIVIGQDTPRYKYSPCDTI